MFQKSMFLSSLWDSEWREKNLTFDNILSALLSKFQCEFREQQFDFFWNNFYPPILFEVRARIVETFYAKYFARLLKLHSTSIDKQSEENPSFRKKLVLHIFSRLREENNLTSDNLVSALLTRLRFSVLELNFEMFFLQFWNSSSISGFQYELLRYVAQKFRHSRQKCILRVQAKVWRKIGFRLQSVTVFKNIWTLHKSLSDFRWESAAHSSGLHSTCTRARFEKNYICFKKYVSFIIMGLRVERKKIWLLTIFCPHCCQNFNVSLENNNLIFFGTIFILLSFLRSEQELLRLFTQNILHVCWNCILRL